MERATYGRKTVHIGAPGVNICSTYLQGGKMHANLKNTKLTQILTKIHSTQNIDVWMVAHSLPQL